MRKRRPGLWHPIDLIERRAVGGDGVRLTTAVAMDHFFEEEIF